MIDRARSKPGNFIVLSFSLTLPLRTPHWIETLLILAKATAYFIDLSYQYKNLQNYTFMIFLQKLSQFQFICNHRNLIKIKYSSGWYIFFGLLKEACYNQVLNRYLLNFSLGLWGLILFSYF
jgi:hypothetical protein